MLGEFSSNDIVNTRRIDRDVWLSDHWKNELCSYLSGRFKVNGNATTHAVLEVDAISSCRDGHYVPIISITCTRNSTVPPMRFSK